MESYMKCNFIVFYETSLENIIKWATILFITKTLSSHYPTTGHTFHMWLGLY